MAYPNAHFILLITGGAHELLRPYVLPETRALTLVLDDSLRLTFGPMLLIPRKTDPGPIGDVQPRLSTLLSSASLLALARAQTAMALVGQLRFPLSDQELADARALYVAARCVAGGAT